MFVVLACACNAVLANENADRYIQRESVRDYIRTVSADNDLNVNRVAGFFSRLTRQQSILDAIARPAERTLTWREYRPIFVTKKRTEGGKAFMREHRALLDQAQTRFGVPAEIITAIIGVETYYGGNTGSYGVLEALATLAFDFPRRSAFFTREMTEFLLLSESEGWDTVSVKGSYAGAMGMPQFISSSYRQYAIDFDEDGTRDLFSSPADIIGSVANYLSRHGWQKAAPIAEQWLPEDGITQPMRQLVRESLSPVIDVETVNAMGFTPSGAKASEALSVMTMDGESGQELWVGYQNFYVITRYNHSRLYAMAVFQLAEAIRRSAGESS
ncbi:MAG: lytic murein transglycosylase B [Granulosicoccus sp.]